MNVYTNSAMMIIKKQSDIQQRKSTTPFFLTKGTDQETIYLDDL
jgi:hypothetical protein